MILAPAVESDSIKLTDLINETSVLMNSWVRSTFINAEELFFKKSREQHNKAVAKIRNLGNKKEGQASQLSERLSKLSINDTTSPYNDNQIECLMGYYRKMLDLYHGYVMYPNPFRALLQDLPPNTNYTVQLKHLLRKINVAVLTEKYQHTDIYALLFLFKNLFFIVHERMRDPNVHVDSKFIKQWIKLGANLIQQIKTLETSDALTDGEMFLVQNKTDIATYCKVSALWIASIEIEQAKTDLELMYAESFVTAADDFYQQLTDPDVKKAFSFNQQKIYAYYILIAAKSNDYERMMSYADKIDIHAKFLVEIINACVAIAIKNKDNDPKTALCFYQKAICHAKLRNPNQVGGNSLHYKEETAKLEKLVQEMHQEVAFIKIQCAQNIINKVKSLYPNIKAKKGKVPGQLELFIPSAIKPTITSCLQNQYKQFKLTAFHDAKFTGLSIVTENLNESEVMSALARLEKLTANAKIVGSSAVKVDITPQPEAHSPVEIVSTSKREKIGIIESPVERYIKPPIIERTKTKAIGPVPAPAATAPVARRELNTSDFGFEIDGNPSITPVYCSNGAQQAQRTKLFLRWEGIPECDTLVEKQFQEMLNPHPEGILTVGTYGQPGAKIWKDPDGLGEEWGQCALRLKRKGAGGFMRAVAVPECKITIDNNGISENRYLFKLGKMKHK